jgi:CheY-like chemotaxis protein
VICDIGLRGIDGYAVAGDARRPTLNRAALVALTGYVGPPDMAKAKEAGFDVHLAKPSTEAIEKVLEDVQGRGQGHSATS